ncbi:MAG: hypothetical protein JNL43_09950 [Flavobacteriales bacterium]|nr:hypothetical protein [Flavobacteriales bacterium]
MRALARFLSIVLHPLVMPTCTVWLALHVDPQLGYFLPQPSRWTLIGMLALMTILFPITSAFLLLRSGSITSLEMPTRQERIAPLVMTLVYYGMAYYLLRQAPLHPVISGAFMGILAALLLTVLITLRWKISAHMVGIGGLIGAITGIATIHGIPLLIFIAGLTLLAGLLATARLLTSDHTQGQVLAGATLGWCCTYTCIVLGWAI